LRRTQTLLRHLQEKTAEIPSRVDEKKRKKLCNVRIFTLLPTSNCEFLIGIPSFDGFGISRIAIKHRSSGKKLSENSR
jgi:hypothetical protein